MKQKIRKFSDKFEIIAGPCSIESEGQINYTIKLIKEYLPQIKYFRGGCWKPRTRPNMFEGIGCRAADWLANITYKNNLIPVTEIGTVDHLSYCLTHLNMTTFWIGARTAGDPFAVQAIADEISRRVVSNDAYKNELYVFVKNPIAPDMDLWIGAIERILNSGISGVGAIYRGTYFEEKKRNYICENCNNIDEYLTWYKNFPDFDMIKKIHEKFPQMSIFVDPSHIAGDCRLIKHFISKMPKDLSIDGLLIETHCNPEEAITDRSQQLTPAQLVEVLEIYNEKA